MSDFDQLAKDAQSIAAELTRLSKLDTVDMSNEDEVQGLMDNAQGLADALADAWEETHQNDGNDEDDDEDGGER